MPPASPVSHTLSVDKEPAEVKFPSHGSLTEVDVAWNSLGAACSIVMEALTLNSSVQVWQGYAGALHTVVSRHPRG